MNFKPPKPLFPRTIWNYTHHYKKNFVMVITGSTGEGKSLTGVKIGELVDPRFNIDKVTYDSDEFMDAVGAVKRSGEVIIWDEAGVGLPSREWHSVSNKVINYVIQTFRKDKACIIFITPDLSFIDVQARKMIRAFTEARRYRREATKLWIYRMSIDRKSGKIYYPHPLYLVDDAIVKLKYAIIHLPAKELVVEYERKANKWKEKLKRDVIRTVELMKKKEGIRQKTIFDMINIVMKNRKKYVGRKGILDRHLIQTHLGIGEHKALQIKKFIEQKQRGI